MTPQKISVLDREYLEIRSKILQLAAVLDRVERCSESGDARMAKLHEALRRLLQGGAGRAEAVQMIFSRTYDSNWQAEFGITTRP